MKIFINILLFTFKPVFQITLLFFSCVRVKVHFPLWIIQMNQQLLLKQNKKILNRVFMCLRICFCTLFSVPFDINSTLQNGSYLCKKKNLNFRKSSQILLQKYSSLFMSLFIYMLSLKSAFQFLLKKREPDKILIRIDLNI